MSQSIPGYVDYTKREYCKAIQCPVQMRLDALEPSSPEYEAVRKECKDACIHTTHEFHAWLIQAGYLVVKPQ